ncbi:MAG: flavin reductase family protein [Lachnospiraceae bacterium]|nr:flavin reductase family protein [Lachnospiraceae bacterium]
MSNKQIWRPGNMLYPLPAVLVTTRNAEGKDNVCTVAWTGTICSDPVMVSISLRPERLSYTYLKETGVFVINLTTEQLAFATDFCGVRSGRDLDKFREMKLTKEEADKINCSMIAESPVNLECRVTEEKALGSHTMFIAEVTAVHADEAYMNEKGTFSLNMAKPLVYSHGEYRAVGRKLGSFGYSVRKKSTNIKKKVRGKQGNKKKNQQK